MVSLSERSPKGVVDTVKIRIGSRPRAPTWVPEIQALRSEGYETRPRMKLWIVATGRREAKVRSEAERRKIELSKNDLRARGETRRLGGSLHGQPRKWSPMKTGRLSTTTTNLPRWFEGAPQGALTIRREAFARIRRRIDDGPAMRPQRGHVASNGVGKPAACPMDKRLMSVPGNERVANAVPPFEKGSESNLRVLFYFTESDPDEVREDQPSGVIPRTMSKRPVSSPVLVPGMRLKSTETDSFSLGSPKPRKIKSLSLRGSPLI